jgi:hypothetical protein
VAGARGGRRRGQQEDEGKQRRGGSHGDQTNVREGVEGLGAAEIYGSKLLDVYSSI